MDYLDNQANQDLYKWNKHDAKLKARMKDASSIRMTHHCLNKRVIFSRITQVFFLQRRFING
jgi:hypothetical protein